MSRRTGLGPLERHVLETVARVVGGDRSVRSQKVIDALEEEGFGPAYVYPVICDLTAPWKVHLRLLEGVGNWGSAGNDPPADPQYTEIGLSDLGRAVLACEDGALGPIPVGLVEGSLYRGGRVPPWDPHAVVECLRMLLEDPGVPDERLHEMLGPPVAPTGGPFLGDLAALYAGLEVLFRATSLIHREQRPDGRHVLVITGTPLGVSIDNIPLEFAGRLHRRRYADYLSEQERTLVEARNSVSEHVHCVDDETNQRVGTRIVLTLDPDAGEHLDAIEDWVRGIWPVTVPVPLHLPEPIATTLRSWAGACRADRSGLDALGEVIEGPADRS